MSFSRIAVATVLLIGLGAGGLLSDFAAPSHAAGGGRFEYKVVKLPPMFGEGTEGQLNALDADGWEIAYGYGEAVILKRAR